MKFNSPAGRVAGIALTSAILATAATANQSEFEAKTLSALALDNGEITTVDFVGAPGRDTVVTVDYAGSQLTFDLSPHSAMRATGRLLEDRGDGELVEVEHGLVRTYRGSVRELPGSLVAGGWMEDGFYARVQNSDGTDLWVQPLADDIEGATAGQHIVYTGDDIQFDVNNRCGGGLLANIPTLDTFGPAGGVSQLGGAVSIAELGCDADFEFFQDHGSTSTGVMNRINLVIDSMNLQYESQVAITHDITTIIVRTTSSDPYTSTNSSTLLGEFQGEWNSNQGSIQRDVAHLFTGKSIQSGVIGIAFVGVICSIPSAYGLVESDFNNNFGCATDLSAHELGHNWNAGHCTCSGNTMNASITCANSFTSASISTIENHRDSRNCLDTGALPPVANFTGTPTSGFAPLLVNFTDTSTNGPSSWLWSFGDGATGTAQNPSHSYATAGVFSVVLIATNANGSDTETKLNYVSVTGSTAGSCTNRIGSGANPDIYDCVSIPTIGSTWVSTVDAGSVGVNGGLSFVFGFGLPSVPLPTVFGEFLVDPTSGQLVFNTAIILGGTATHNVPIANDVSIIGFPVSTQGFLNIGMLLNAIDIVIGS